MEGLFFTLAGIYDTMLSEELAWALLAPRFLFSQLKVPVCGCVTVVFWGGDISESCKSVAKTSTTKEKRQSHTSTHLQYICCRTPGYLVFSKNLLESLEYQRLVEGLKRE